MGDKVKRMFLGCEVIETVTLNDEEYIKLADIPRIVEYAYGKYLAEKFRNSMNNVRFVCDEYDVHIENTDKIKLGE